jgi:hypothetical protein
MKLIYNGCGFVSLFYALKYEKEDILKKYKIESVEDLYNLFMNEVFDKYKHQPFLKSWPVSTSVSIEKLFRWKYMVYLTDENIKKDNMCNVIYMAMMAKYLNIHINLIKKDILQYSGCVKLIPYMSQFNKQIINPECVVSIHLSHINDNNGHVEYIGKTDDEKKELYELEKQRELLRNNFIRNENTMDEINCLEKIGMDNDNDDYDDFIQSIIQDLNNDLNDMSDLE